MSVLVMSDSSLQKYELLTGEVSEANAGELILPAVIGTLLFFLVVKKLKSQIFLSQHEVLS